jgi:hypothetical protein
VLSVIHAAFDRAVQLQLSLLASTPIDPLPPE